MSDTFALIIDDNQNNLGVLAEMLTLEGVNYSAVKDARQFESVLGSMSQVDVIFLDLEMPGLDGYQVLERIQSSERFNTVPVVAYTVHVSEVNVARKRGFHSFLGKPLNADRFPEQLARILNGERVWDT